MIFNKSIFAVAVMALANVVAAGTTTAQTPACVLKIIGHQDNPADSKAICGKDAASIQSDIADKCADSDTALKFFVSNCAQLGHKVVETSPSSTATSGSASASASGFVTAASSSGAAATGSGTGSSAAATGTGSSSSESGSASSPTSTFNAASSDRQFSATTFAAAIFLGAAALL
ncbi:hypothetical protein N7499_012623 [Penicillium canescens]|uniref:GPI anchored cell wall protein n=1 Tax=Penicillium canescens TaxID=5083 RepID=A0AAD6N571_PENCN|nr:uncharacterized protein N7446_000734 [Penicillium canescens]KAJ6030205.1 hypothetical protein N7460_010471 [Penicillium canescens]KAJ6060580.1 hypothetical protein N7444_002434 [Penicillium canescens]KAJ6063943.1 hypothetical protein N7499_012623 [Penicillium canescens]KAJ6077798.1 hypothetical protein N7446_000734 [Penicillium canescens]KAJ6154561.1 hypothetical protein N7485_012930 [Penicillium canescens]